MRVPEGWTQTTVGEVLERVADPVVVDPSKTYQEIGIRSHGKGLFNKEPVSGAVLGEKRVFWIQPDCFILNIVFAWERAVGRTTVEDVGKIASHRFPMYRPKSGLADVDYILYFFKTERGRELLALASPGGAGRNKTLGQKEFLKLPLCLPPLRQQRRIAEILSSIDEAIAATQMVIEQTRVVKQGVLERLLTRGIGHTRFKKTDIGEIPEKWEVLRLESVLANVNTPMRSGPFGSALKKEELVESGIPFLGIDNVHAEQFVSKYKRFVTEEKFNELHRFAVRPRDVMITIMGTVGRCCVVPASIGLALSSKHVWAMTLDQRRCIPELVCWQLNYAPWILKEFERSAQGGVMGAINSSVLRELQIPVPPLEEQSRILGVWSRFQDALKAEDDKLGRLISMKFTLISNLTTGRKRLPVNTLAAAE
ncbi:restriction endonuclease subunit S [Azospirillum sp. sgz302134]